MLRERQRRDPGEPIGFWRFVIIASIVITTLRSLITGKPPGTGGVLPFAFLGYLAYRVARLQPWWPFGEVIKEDRQEPAQLFPEPPPRPQAPPQSLGRVATAKRKVEVEVSGKAHRSIREVGIASKSNPERDGTSNLWGRKAKKQEFADYALSSSAPPVELRLKTVRTKTVRSKTTHRKKRK